MDTGRELGERQRERERGGKTSCPGSFKDASYFSALLSSGKCTVTESMASAIILTSSHQLGPCNCKNAYALWEETRPFLNLGCVCRGPAWGGQLARVGTERTRVIRASVGIFLHAAGQPLGPPCKASWRSRDVRCRWWPEAWTGRATKVLSSRSVESQATPGFAKRQLTRVRFRTALAYPQNLVLYPSPACVIIS